MKTTNTNTIASIVTTSVTSFPTSLDIWMERKKNLTYKNRNAGFAEWEQAVIREMVQSGEIRRENQYWGGYTTVLEFLGREYLGH